MSAPGALVGGVKVAVAGDERRRQLAAEGERQLHPGQQMGLERRAAVLEAAGEDRQIDIGEIDVRPPGERLSFQAVSAILKIRDHLEIQ